MKSKSKKTEFRWFSITQWQQEQDYLRQRHQSGWKFVRVGFPGIYHFERCEPEDVIYQLDYNQEGLENKSEYVQMFGDCGWEYLQDFVGYSYFRKPVSQMDGEEEIFCDDSSRLDMMKRVLKGRLYPLITIFFCIVIPQLLFQGYRGSKIFSYLFGALFIAYLALFASFGYQFWKYQKTLRK